MSDAESIHFSIRFQSFNMIHWCIASDGLADGLNFMCSETLLPPLHSCPCRRAADPAGDGDAAAAGDHGPAQRPAGDPAAALVLADFGGGRGGGEWRGGGAGGAGKRRTAATPGLPHGRRGGGEGAHHTGPSGTERGTHAYTMFSLCSLSPMDRITWS